MQNRRKNTLGTHAIVIGGSITGLLAARVLADYFTEVSVIERDEPSDQAGPRRGVPQGHQLHMLHYTGAAIFQQLFPDLQLDAATSGVTPCRVGRELQWHQFGAWRTHYPVDFNIYCCQRMELEGAIRRQVAALPNVTLQTGQRVLEPVASVDRSLIVGMRTQEVKSGGEHRIYYADLVVDASGRGSRTPQWLEVLGYPAPTESVVKVNVGYGSRIYGLPADATPDWTTLAISPQPGISNRMGVLYRLDKQRIHVGMAGWFGEHPPADDAGFLTFAQGLPQPDLHEVIRKATPLSPIYTYKFAANRWRHFERMQRWPGQYLVMGDAVCSFNPAYAQGMTVVAFEAELLQKKLQQLVHSGNAVHQAGFAHNFQRAVARTVRGPWLIAVGEDLRYPELAPTRPWMGRLLDWYMGQLGALYDGNSTVARRLIDVVTLAKSPTTLFQPDLLFTVLKQQVTLGVG